MKKLLVLLLIPAAVEANGLQCTTWKNADGTLQTICCDSNGLCY